MKKRLLSLFLAVIMLSGTLVSCSESNAGETGEANPSNQQPSVVGSEEAPTEPEKDSLEAREDVPDGVPDKDFGGKTFSIAGDEQFEDYYLTEEQNGDVVNDAVFARNAVVMDRFNTEITASVFEESSITGNVKNSVLAGDDAYQLISGHIIYLGMAATDKIMYNMADLPYIDFSKPWWSDSTVNDLTYKGMTFIGIGDFALSAVEQTYCMFYNKGIAQNFGLPDMYDLVYAGDWTIDKEMELSTGVYTDTNGNGSRDKEDLYALSTSTKSAANAYL